ncbi:TolC family protein [Maribacter hydrothermalis]|uniref:Outer membrane protein beta-barrel domain-containing protein n=1 Tax=Maribacter hydrothermalis TaxID=1836467 RepID=A0A1B7ZDS4_9FLAO|nr:hypothetical protein [Maribacter hydrothermalis]APQ16596.1 hypothetical protein BTR34_04275 [Maribacter hydrothermalis]OBR41498.1 hypothetical protein A9200_12760 [Maribacter hydrothermalis]
MKTITTYFLALLTLFMMQNLMAQEDYEKRIETLREQKVKITRQEKEALKYEVENINERLENGSITTDEANLQKQEAAEKRALNIENRITIIENQINLLERNKGKALVLIEFDTISDKGLRLGVDINGKPAVLFKSMNWKNEIRYDRRTYSDFVMAVGLNNAIVEGQSLNDSPYKIGGSRFFEMGWQWRTRVFKNSNFMRLNYGFSFQFNGLKPKDNQYLVSLENGQSELQEFDYELDKSKFRMDNLVFPMHFEFGPSKQNTTEKTMRYSLKNQFRIGIGGYGGFNLGTRQKLKYNLDGDNVKDKLKRSYNTNDLIYGLSAYAGFDGVLLYVKYDLNPIFKDAAVDQHNVSLGLRFDL